MKHETEINQILIELSLDILGKTKQQLSDEIEIGIKNGYPVEKQVEIIRTCLKPLIHQSK